MTTKTITLQSLVLTNIKGIRELALVLEGKNVNIFGDNATGKTTINDGLTWLLFDKDSLNRKDFQLKTVDSQNNEIHNLEHAVEGVFLVDGVELSLKKVFKEKWTKKRGAATADFTGHTTDYFVNGVPSKKGEYVNKVAELVSEDTFKLLTTPTFFNEFMKWQDRRSVLMEIAGDLTDAEVIASSDKLKALEAILGSHSIADHRKMVASKKTAINKELNAIPVRIDEVRRSMVDTNGASEHALKENIENAQDKVNVQNETILHLQNGGAALDLKGQITFQQAELEEKKFAYSEKNYAALNRKRAEIQKLNDKSNDLTIELKQAQNGVGNMKNYLSTQEKELEEKRGAWVTLNAQTFDEHKNTCTMCGQEFPEEKRLELVDAFNVHKAEQLEKLAKEGKAAAAEVENGKIELSSREKNVFAIETELKEVNRQKQEASEQFESMKQGVTRFEDTKEYLDIQNEIASLTTKMNDVKSMAAESVQAAQNQINDIKQYIASQEAVLNQIKQNEASEKRITELEEQQQQLAAEYEKIEHQLFLTEEFIRTKVNLLEDKINSKFKMAKFKLFNTQINGAVEECCETIYNGVPYSKGLNNAARINVGLDIINTLSEHYGVKVPIFVDNAEAVTKLLEVETQLIALRVNEQDKKLRVEVQG
ncbi:nucleoside triphospate hydrolase [Bacillus phage poppyseed]|uniref:Nucleoside triphosphate hydrolase n=2 Tax=Bacillus phage Page TaxID=1406786 RepID=U5PZF6_9CAUD|nr:SbcC-like subunit of palindrome specific endonuclease [Bacillus phage Page]AGY47953.1 nucleoside triphosphate hydrolase [Bacillus phage Page]AGY48048.1 nucleoside triphospate hydrolase [Bacillus phage poppyseed]